MRCGGGWYVWVVGCGFGGCCAAAVGTGTGTGVGGNMGRFVGFVVVVTGVAEEEEEEAAAAAVAAAPVLSVRPGILPVACLSQLGPRVWEGCSLAGGELISAGLY